MVKSFSKIVAMLFVLCIALYSCDTPESIVDEEGAQTEEPADEENPDGEDNTDEENPDENEPVVTPDDGIIKILAIGNSFSQDAVEQYLYELFEAEGIKAVIGNLYIGGCSLEKHWSNASSGAAQYAYRKVEDGNKKETANVTMEYGILDEDWDYISLQQVSGKSGLYETYNPYLPNLIKYVEGLATNTEMKLMLHQTWAYASNSTHADFPNYGNDQIAMYKAIVSAVDRAAVDNGIEIVIPSGTAIQNGRNSYLGDSFNRDGYHLETTYGRYTAACTWFEKISGLDVRENPYSPNLDAQLKKLVQSAAHRAVQNPSVADPMTDFQAPEAEVDDFSALYIDFGSHSASGLPWNNVAVSSLGDGDNIFLKDGEGGYTGVTISGISGFTGMYNGVGTEPKDEDLTVDDITYIRSAWVDGLIASGTKGQGDVGPAKIVFSGLNPEYSYDFHVFSLRFNGSPDARISRFTVEGAESYGPEEIDAGMKTFDASAADSHEAVFNEVRPASDGTVVLSGVGVDTEKAADLIINATVIIKR